MLVSVTSLPISGEYQDDTWLGNVIGPERLEAGDEFGCQTPESAMESINFDFVEECKAYLSGRINASRWGEQPISIGTPQGDLSLEFRDVLYNSGFSVVGDLSNSDDDRFTVIHRNGGTVESGLSNRSLIESADEGELISLYWIARIDDMNIRRDRDLVEWLSDQDYWFTTWGEWVTHQKSSSSITVETNSNSATFSNPTLGIWDTPGTVLVENVDQDITLEWSGVQYDPLEKDERILRAGHREDTDGLLYLTIPPGDTVTIHSAQPMAISHAPSIFNGLKNGITIAGHHTTNMREWSQDFRDAPLRFTWLIERSELPSPTLVLPLLSISILIATPVIIRKIIANDKEHQRSISGPSIITP